MYSIALEGFLSFSFPTNLATQVRSYVNVLASTIDHTIVCSTASLARDKKHLIFSLIETISHLI